jgi:threonine aldolase
VDLDRVKSNIVYMDVSGTNLDAAEFLNRLATLGVRALPMGPALIRMVTYRNIESSDVTYAIEACRRVASGEPVPSTGEVAQTPYAG